MAGDWIKMRMDLPDDPAVYKLAALTKLDRFSVIGRLYAFWAWADRHAVDGRVDGATSTLVDDIVRHDGFSECLQQVGWLVVEADSITLPKHERHNGESAKERALKNARQSRWREKKDDVDASPSTKASTREEKRREDIKPLALRFDQFWKVYPKKASKGQAEKAFAKVSPDEQLLADILTAIERAKTQDSWLREDGKFIPHPATWLNAKGWLDEFESSPQITVDA